MLSRRSILFGTAGNAGPKIPLRPPWTDPASIGNSCTGCGDCIDACPQSIIFSDTDGRPEIRFGDHECTFCGECAAICPEDVFRSPDTEPWPLRVQVGGNCLLNTGVSCQLCIDACQSDALNFEYSKSPMGAISVQPDRCTGCGACLSFCPVGAITIHDQRIDGPANG